MSTAVQSTIAPRGYWSDLEYLLLGDLRQVLDEPSTLLRDRWLVSLLDVLLAGNRHESAQSSSIGNSVAGSCPAMSSETIHSDSTMSDRADSMMSKDSLSQRLSTCLTTSPSTYSVQSSYASASIRNDFLTGEREQLYSKLQRLRDRVAHRTPASLLSNEIRCDLQDLLPV
ncbi:hypothetical protein [Planctopirus hydrillae]|uniref:Uncharacterized protein n=1 Tax=Planctopirus hydrillae TaxID=1841610 RepID=A0A1C3E6Q3_9PLAN|nr:hypothetical protein [Planctopirus hydrillae]ODA28937.1 hypothetical protein A6X21_10620 [Planctopirus hydrillae]